MATQPHRPLTSAEYLAIERAAESRSEYLDGEMAAMTGGSRLHNLVVTNLVRELSGQLRDRPCEVYPSDLRVQVAATGLYTYPDVVVVCGEPRFEDEQADTLLNPTLLIEVLSPSTESYDRGKKFEHYQRLGSLAEYLLVAQHEPRVEQFVRQTDGRWLYAAVDGLDGRLALVSIGVELAMAEIYHKVLG